MCRASRAGRPASCSARCRCFATGVVPGQFGVKYDGVGLDARLDHRPVAARARQADHAERARLHPHRDAGSGREPPGAVDARCQRMLAPPTVAEARRSRRAAEEDGPAPVRVLGQRQPVELRPDERRRVGRHSARRSRRAAEAVEGRDRRAGQRLRSHRPEFAALDRRRQLGVPARRVSTSSAPSSPRA